MIVRIVLGSIAAGAITCVIACCGGVPTATPPATAPATTAAGDGDDANTVNVDAPDPASLTEPSGPDMADVTACRLASDYVRRVLKTPSVAEFPGTVLGRHEYDVRRYKGNLIDVRSHVDSQNGFGAMVRSQWRAVIRPIDEYTATPLYLEVEDEVFLDELADELAALKAAEDEALRQAEAEQARIENDRRQAELAELDKAAAPELEALLQTAGDYPDAKSIDPLIGQLKAFVERHKDTASATLAGREIAGLANLRLVYVGKERGVDPTAKLREVVERFPGTVAARAAQSQLDSGSTVNR